MLTPNALPTPPHFASCRPDGQEVWLEETAKAEFDAAGQLVCLKGLTLDVTARKLFEDQQKVLIAAPSIIASRICWRALPSQPRARAKAAVPSTRTFEHSIGAFDRWPIPTRCLARIAWKDVDLAALVRHQLAPYATDANMTIGGPNVTLTVAAAQTLATVLHELVTNAAEYGALSTPHGRVEVSCSCSPVKDAANLSIDWRELGGPAVTASPDCRYGVSIIRNLIPQELSGSVDLAFKSSGVCCKMEIPLGPRATNARARSCVIWPKATCCTVAGRRAAMTDFCRNRFSHAR